MTSNAQDDQHTHDLPRILKAWQIGHGTVVLSISPPRALYQAKVKKLFITLDVTRGKPNISLRQDKPTEAEPKGIIADQIRKHIINARILSIHRDRQDTLELDIQAQESRWKIICHSSKPSSIALVDPNSTVVGKVTGASAFTKKHTIKVEDFVDIASREEIQEQLFGELVGQKVDGKLADIPTHSMSAAQRDLIQRIRRRMRTAKKSLKRLGGERRTAADVDASLLTANLLRENLHLIEPHQEKITAVDSASGRQVLIDLDPDKTPGENLDRTFRKYKKDLGALKHTEGVVAQTETYLSQLAEAIEILSRGEIPLDTQMRIAAKCKIPQKQVREVASGVPTPTLPFRIVKCEGVEFRVGKGPSENDLLTKSAKGNDWWIHVVQGGGSHVIIPSKFAVGGKLPPDIARNGAILALHYSRARTAREGEVYVTQRQHLRKTKGLKPGLWLVDRSEVTFVRYDEEELRRALSAHSDENESDA